MVCAVYICLICLKQITTSTKIKLLNIKVVYQPCQAPDIEESEIPFDPVTFSREECACNPVRYFAILSMQRSGSGWFETLLNSHVNVSSNGEIFPVRDRMINISSILSMVDKVYNLDWFTSASKNACSAAFGFKWLLNQSHVHSLAEKLREVQEFLRMPYIELTSRQVKIHSGPLSKQVENWNAVEQALKGSLYKSFLPSDYFQM
ncbi:hypothetical protein LWI28_024876 [Acer negundo]|uniref:Sulfotransferase n=1 Tax=Acer negundo TaxID=4023 RepID=A0AAD5IG10_ACENE|nr:hypothetical protein LWI28_024876 [Acer negundo]